MIIVFDAKIARKLLLLFNTCDRLLVIKKNDGSYVYMLGRRSKRIKICETKAKKVSFYFFVKTA